MFLLGDFIHKCLGAVGITPPRVARLLRVKECGCNRRRLALNAYGIELQTRFMQARIRFRHRMVMRVHGVRFWFRQLSAKAQRLRCRMLQAMRNA